MDEYDNLITESTYTDDDALNILIEVRESLERDVPKVNVLNYIEAYLIDIGRL